MSTTPVDTAPVADYTKDVAVRIYEVVTKPDGNAKIHHFNVSISLTWAESRQYDRDAPWCMDQVWKRVSVVTARDKIDTEADTVTFIRETLVHSSKARPIRKRTNG